VKLCIPPPRKKSSEMFPCNSGSNPSRHRKATTDESANILVTNAKSKITRFSSPKLGTLQPDTDFKFKDVSGSKCQECGQKGGEGKGGAG